jgi:hypothetical protein
VANNLGELSAVASLNNQQYLPNLKATADQTKTQVAAVKSSFMSLNTIGASLGIGGAGGVAAILGLDLIGKAKEGWTMIFNLVRSVAQETRSALDPRIAERYTNAVRQSAAFNQVRDRLTTQVRQLGMTDAQRDADQFRGTATSADRQAFIREQHTIIDAYRRHRENLEQLTNTQRETASGLDQFRERVLNISEFNLRNLFRPAAEQVANLDAANVARGVARLFQGLPDLDTFAQLPNALDRESVEAVSAINAAASARGGSRLDDMIARLEAMHETAREQERLGRELVEAMRQNPRLRGLLRPNF